MSLLTTSAASLHQLGAAAAFAGSARHAVTLGSAAAPGHVRNTLPETSITIGELDGRPSERMARLRNAFERAGVAVGVAPDILSARWEKLLLVGPWRRRGGHHARAVGCGPDHAGNAAAA
jgi:ketopantoate reductase